MTDDKSAAPERLLPCPFCGSNDVEREGWVGMDVDHKKISGPACNGCGASAESVSAWNRRVLIDTPAPPTPAKPAGDALLPCPFCGNEGSGPIEDALHMVFTEHDWRAPSWTVQCDKCTATMGYSDSEDEAREAWNRRSALAAAPQPACCLCDDRPQAPNNPCGACGKTAPQPAPSYEDLLDKIDGLESDLDSAVEVAIKRGAVEWGRLNYPSHPALIEAPQPECPRCGSYGFGCYECTPETQPAPAEREALERLTCTHSHLSPPKARDLADALLARGLRLPRVTELPERERDGGDVLTPAAPGHTEA